MVVEMEREVNCVDRIVCILENGCRDGMGEE